MQMQTYAGKGICNASCVVSDMMSVSKLNRRSRFRRLDIGDSPEKAVAPTVEVPRNYHPKCFIEAYML